MTIGPISPPSLVPGAEGDVYSPQGGVIDGPVVLIVESAPDGAASCELKGRAVTISHGNAANSIAEIIPIGSGLSLTEEPFQCLRKDLRLIHKHRVPYPFKQE